MMPLPITVIGLAVSAYSIAAFVQTEIVAYIIQYVIAGPQQRPLLANRCLIP